MHGEQRVRKVAVVAYHSTPLAEPGSGDAGGMTVYVKELARSLAGLGVSSDIFTRRVSARDRVTTIYPRVRIVPIDAGPLTAVPKTVSPAFLPEFVDGVRAFAVAQRTTYDVVHSHYWQSGIAASRLAEKWKMPFVHSNHTLGRVKNTALAPGDDPEPASRIAGEDDVISRADALIASTEDEYRHLACLYKAQHDRLKIVTPGVDHSLFKPLARLDARRRLGLNDDGPILLCVGRIQPLKGLDLAVAALEELHRRGAVAPRLVLVGGASGEQGEAELARLRGMGAGSGLEDHVRFAGPQPHTLLPFFYAAADVVLICSHSESFGLAALEAHACGRPVVGTPVGGLSHVVRSGSTGFLVPERDAQRVAVATEQILVNADLARSFERDAAASAARFTWEHAAQRLHELCECLIAARDPLEACLC